MGRGYGTFLGVRFGWYSDYSVNENALRTIYGQLRNEAVQSGCSHFSGRDDMATNPEMFDEVVRRYESATQQKVPQQNYPHFRRWLLLLFKGGDMP